MDSNSRAPANRLVTIAIGLIALIFVLALLAGLVAHFGADTRGSVNDSTSNGQVKTNNPSSPDPVKEKTGPTGDIQPSPNGTAPGGNNSILSQ